LHHSAGSTSITFNGHVVSHYYDIHKKTTYLYTKTIIPVVYVIIEAQQRANSLEAVNLWDLIDRICSVHPKLIIALERPDIVAIGRLIVLAWHQRQEYLQERNEVIHKPKCVTTMEVKLCLNLPDSTATDTDFDWNVDEFMNLDFDMINWMSWEKDGYTQVLN